MRFKDKTVVITGAAKGIGAACAELFHASGAQVVLLDTALPSEAPEKERWLFMPCDVSVATDVRQAFSTIRERFGSIHYLVNNAGIQRYGTVTDTSEEEWDEVLNVNLKSMFLCAKYGIPLMEAGKKGVIINVASVQAFVSQQRVAAYTTAKTAILGLTRSIAVDYAPDIRCVAVCPGTVNTPMLQKAIAVSPDPDEVMQECINMHLAKRIGEPAEIAELIAFLCEDKAGFITGQAIRIDGGLGISIGGSKRE